MKGSDDTQEPVAAETDRAARRPYEKPSIAWEESMEVRPSLMAVCAKQAGDMGPCDAGGASS
jgi:hypothetical protein